MPGINKRVYFFEEASPKRDTGSWWKQIESKVLCWGMEVVGLTSDRARALVKLGDESYLNVVSMPDLFHFVQDIAKAVGCRIGLKKGHLQKKVDQCTDGEQKAALEVELTQVTEQQKAYREQIQQINKTVQPFDDSDEWQSKEQLEKGLLQCFTKIGHIAAGLGIDMALEKAMKILDQIPDMVAAVQAWNASIPEQLQQWACTKAIPNLHRQWLEKCALPFAYWQVQLGKTQAKARNKDLRAYYTQRVHIARNRYEQDSLTAELDENTRQQYLDKAFRLAASFQRSSSQVEGRNGYLAFVHHAHKGIPKQRLAVLTVVHNFDIRRADGSTPAQRLFSRQFPDLFDFLCQNVTGFKEPRQRKPKPLICRAVQL